MEKPVCILILGMHRSGTSAVAGSLAELGVYFGKNLMPALPENKKGFFENWTIYRLNEEVLHSLGRNWHSIKSIPSDWYQKVASQNMKNRISKAIISEFGVGDKSTSAIAIKDPRLALLLPLYEQLLIELNYKIIYVNVLRNSLSVAKSLQARNDFSIRYGFTLSEFYKSEIRKKLKDKEVVNIEFEKFVEDPLGYISKIGNILNISVNDTDFIEKSLSHQRNNSLLDRLNWLYLKAYSFLKLWLS